MQENQKNHIIHSASLAALLTKKILMNQTCTDKTVSNHSWEGRKERRKKSIYQCFAKRFIKKMAGKIN